MKDLTKMSVKELMDELCCLDDGRDEAYSEYAATKHSLETSSSEEMKAFFTNSLKLAEKNIQYYEDAISKVNAELDRRGA